MTFPVVVLISAGAEWRVVKSLIPGAEIQPTPYGEYFVYPIGGAGVVFLHGGWGKIAAAGSTQYAVDRWNPGLLINLGTCGGIKGMIETGDVVLAEETLVYDIYEQMGDADEALAHYSSRPDLSWLREPLPLAVKRIRLISADRDLMVGDLPVLRSKYQAAAVDWESGAIAWVAGRNGKRCLILRAVTDLVSEEGGEAYGNYNLFAERTRQMMGKLIDSLPAWMEML